MQDCDDLVTSLRERGVNLWTERGQLHFRAPRGTLSAGDLHELRARKGHLVQWLGEAELLRGVPAQRQTVTTPVPLTALQMRTWQRIAELNSYLSQRTCIVAQRLIGPLDIEALRTSLRVVVQRHDSLRIKLVATESAVEQQVDADYKHELTWVDLQDTAQCHEQQDVMAACEQFAKEPVDLRVGPMLAAKLYRVSADEHVLMVAMDHMVSDGISRKIVARDIWAVYRRLLRGLPAELPAPELQFLEYVIWQHRTYDAWQAKHADYWRQRMADLPQTNLPSYEGWSRIAPPVSHVRTFAFNAGLAGKLRDLARRERRLPALVALAIYAVTMARWADQPDFVVTFVSNGRDRPELQDMVGFLAEYLHLRLQVSDQETFMELMQRLSNDFSLAYEHQDYGRMPDLVPACVPELGFNWLANSAEEDPVDAEGEMPGGRLRIEPLNLQLAFPLPQPIKLVALFRDTGAEIVGGMFYRPDIFSPEAIEQFARRLESFAAEVCERPHTRLDEDVTDS